MDPLTVVGLQNKEPRATEGDDPAWYWMGRKHTFERSESAGWYGSSSDAEWLESMKKSFLPDAIFDKLTGYCQAVPRARFYDTREEAMAAFHRALRASGGL